MLFLCQAPVRSNRNIAFDNAAKTRTIGPRIIKYGSVVNGDAHRLAEMGARTIVHLALPTVSELRLALSNQEGRSVRITAQIEDKRQNAVT